MAAALVGAVFAFLLHAWIAYVLLGLLLLVVRSSGADEASRGSERPSTVLRMATGAALLSLAVTHAVFFGAGRYSLVVFPLVTAVAALAWRRAPRSCSANLLTPPS
ncbi:MAG: hypothetical protein R3F14_35730 [Polyangiaceae bacterium]